LTLDFAVVIAAELGSRKLAASGESGIIDAMTVIKINALTVPAEMGEEVAKRFAARAGAVDGHDGFEGFELLRPTDERTTWLVVTRWRDLESFEAWRTSSSFAHGHGAEAPGTGGDGAGEARAAQPPMPIQSELWSYDVAISSMP
jgi:heme oxygenase (mycobilin-producing)